MEMDRRMREERELLGTTDISTRMSPHTERKPPTGFRNGYQPGLTIRGREEAAVGGAYPTRSISIARVLVSIISGPATYLPAYLPSPPESFLSPSRPMKGRDASFFLISPLLLRWGGDFVCHVLTYSLTVLYQLCHRSCCCRYIYMHSRV